MIAPARHQVQLEQAPATDFERLEDIGAAAIAASRCALACVEELDGDTAHALRREIGELRKIVENRSALSNNARQSLRSLALALQARLNVDSVDALGPVLEAVIDCLTASERVADLLAAERHIGRCRGLV